MTSSATARNPGSNRTRSPPNVGARLAPQRQGSRIAAKFDADLLEDSIGGPIDQVQPFLVHQVVQWNSAPYTCDRRGAGGGAALPASAGAGAAPGVGGAARDGALLHCGSIRRRRKLTD